MRDALRPYLDDLARFDAARDLDALAGQKALVTGGLGMIGSTLAHYLVALGVEVTIADACLEPYGAKEFNIADIADAVDVSITDIRSREAIKHLVQGKDLVFNFAGQVSHNDSLADPFLDAEINYLGHLNVVDNVLHHSPEARILYSGSRLQFGRIEQVPVAEDHPLRPKTPYAFNKTVAENMYRFYHEVHGVRSVTLRIANPYGIRCQMKHSKYAMVNYFIARAMRNQGIHVFGDGSQLRDYIYVNDVATAFVLCAARDEAVGEVFNLGSGVGTSFKDMAHHVVDVVGSGQVDHVPWPDAYVNVETGDYVTDITKIEATTGWTPAVALDDGIARTVAFYRDHLDRYA